jgi:leader peptidase (prepilin peptidase)/N-methyltransferase
VPALVITYSCVAILGIAIGGIVNSLIDNFLLHESIFHRYCNKCSVEVKLHDQIPIVSFLLLKGRCRSCGAKASKRYPIVELLNGALYLVVFMANGFNFQSFLYCLMTSAFLVISFVDGNSLEIPLPCNLFIGILGIIMCVYDHTHILSYLIGVICVSGVLLVLYYLSGGALIGGGDVKLMAAAGLLLGWQKNCIGVSACLYYCLRDPCDSYEGI